MPLRAIQAAKKAAELAMAAAAEEVEEDFDEVAEEDDGAEEGGEDSTKKGKTRKLALSTSDRTERRRRQCRISQRRYRDKKGSMEYNLKLDINNLRESVERLRQARGLLESKMENDRRVLQQSVLKAVEQYYVMFADGLHDPHAGAHVRKCYDIQVTFLQAFMDPQVQCHGGGGSSGSRVGVDNVLEQWRRYTRYHAAVRAELVRAQVVGSDSDSPLVKATGRLVVTFNRTTLEMLFPHVLADDALTQHLVGRTVEYATCSEYTFDEKVQVIRLDYTVDFLSGLGDVLRDPFLTSAVMRESRISDTGFLGHVEEEGDEKEEDGQEENRTEEDEDSKETRTRSAPPCRITLKEEEEDEESERATANANLQQSRRLDLQFIMS